jgi:hypothetical protein
MDLERESDAERVCCREEGGHSTEDLETVRHIGQPSNSRPIPCAEKDFEGLREPPVP